MKKTILLLASAALLLVGCAKEKFAEPNDGGLTSVTFSASVDGGVATKVAADNDGKGINVNRCIMEIYFQDELYTRLVQTVTPAAGEAKAYATFANVPVVAGKEYQILFWADCGGAEKADLYYTTTSLKAVTVAKTAFIGALEASENDKLDAFCSADNYTVPQSGKSYTATLKRPFAQLNVITTDVGANKTVTSAALLPEKVSVSYKAADVINVATGEVSGTETFTYEAPVHGDWSMVATNHELTLSMDYILASSEQGAVDVTFKTKNGETVVMNHALTNLPYKRNYRTNVKGDLLTTAGSWTATIYPNWSEPEYIHPVVIATTLEEAQAAVGPETTETEAASTIIVKQDAVTNRDQTKDKNAEYVESKTTGIELPEGAKAIEFVLTPQSKEDVTFELPALPTGNFYWYIRHEPNYPTKNLNVKVSEGDVTRVIIDAPNETHVELNDVEYAHVIAITGDNTLVVPAGITVDKLTVKKGGVEIHGIVTELDVAPETGKNVYFRSCEGLSADVFAVIKGEGHNYIDTPLYSERLNANGTYDIISSVCRIGDTYYGSLDAAFKAVPTDAAEATVITVVADANETFVAPGAKLAEGQNVTLDLNGYKLIGTSTNSGYTQYIEIENGAKLAIKDSRTGGAIEYHDEYIESGSGVGGATITCHGCLTVDGGVIENKTPDTNTNDLEGAIDIYTNAWGKAYSPADIVLDINGGVIKSNNANTVRLTSFSAGSFTTSVTVNMNGGEVYGRDGFFIQGVSEGNLNTNTLNLNGGKVYGTQAVRVMAFQNHANTSESKPVTIRIREGVDMQSNYFAQSTKEHWNKGICIDNLSGTYEQLMSYVNIIDAAVCKIGETYYSTLDAAVTAAAPLAQIYLVDNCAENVTVAKNIELFTDGFEFTGKLNPAAGFYTFNKNDIQNLGDLGSWYPEGMDFITLAYPSAEVHDIDCTGDPVKFNTNILETAYSFNAFDTKITREDTGMTDMVLMTKVLGEPDFSKLNNFDLGEFEQAFGALSDAEKNRVNEIISSMLPYLSWIADFEVHFNKDVTEGSLGVSGFYGSYADSEGDGLGMDIDAPAISVGNTYRMLYNYGFEIPYAGICLAVRTFNCGAYRLSDVSGTEMTVDLCLYNSNESSDVKKIVVGTYSYTFPAVSE